MRKNVILGFVFGFENVNLQIDVANEDYFWEGTKEDLYKYFPKSDGIIQLSINNIVTSKYMNGNLMRIFTVENNTKKIVTSDIGDTPLNNSIYSTVILINKSYLSTTFPLNRNADYGWNLVEVHYRGLIYLMKENFDKKAIKIFFSNLDDKNISLFILLLDYLGIAQIV